MSLPSSATPWRAGNWANTASTAARIASRAKGDVQIDGPECGPDGTRSLRECVSIEEELRGISALEAEDRLLDVTDGEHRSAALLGCLAGKKLGGQRTDHPPLMRARVLRLVDQQVVDSAVQLIENPRCVSFLFQKACGRFDQIIEIENPRANFSRSYRS